jgi:hypothetical protein
LANVDLSGLCVVGTMSRDGYENLNDSRHRARPSTEFRLDRLAWIRGSICDGLRRSQRGVGRHENARRSEFEGRRGRSHHTRRERSVMDTLADPEGFVAGTLGMVTFARSHTQDLVEYPADRDTVL